MVRLAGGAVALIGGVNTCTLGDVWMWRRDWGWAPTQVTSAPDEAGSPNPPTGALVASARVAASGLYDHGQSSPLDGGHQVWFGFGGSSSWRAASVDHIPTSGLLRFATPPLPSLLTSQTGK